MQSANVAKPMESKPKPAMAAGQKKGRPIHYPFWFGGSASSMAAVVTHPLDLVKVRNVMSEAIEHTTTALDPTRA
ncbi:hypothetical protein jhhlp_005514 [Lomentospora prolificans]|uniref:Uncharacterized protein n=1 Tax=Lomentospora prolificans TaxID=41688 RepID=A0A2N3N3B5_9PEZI|nr:hypothetical protein jhhlp_005514 [Lomentospora prolificans]